MCERKSSGKLQVPEAIHSDFVSGGDSREILEMALLECLSSYGCSRKAYKKVKVTLLHTDWDSDWVHSSLPSCYLKSAGDAF